MLVLLWAMSTGLRFLASNSETAALGDKSWEVRVSVLVKEPIKPGTIAIAAVPADTSHIRVIGQNLIHQGWRLRFTSDPEWGIGRQTRLVAANTNTGNFELGFTLHQSATPLVQRPSLPRKLSTEKLERYLLNNPLLDLEHDLIVDEINQMTSDAQSSEELLSRIFTRSHQLLPLNGKSSRSIPEVIASGRAGLLERSYVMVALCRAANLPARLVTGLKLSEGTEVRLHHWVEVYNNDKGWLAYDPLHGYQEKVPSNFLPFVRDRADLVEFNSIVKITVNYTITNIDEFLDIPTGIESGWQSVFYLTRLPLEARSVLSHLLLLPLAVLLTTLFRALTGVRSYGTFMPALFALALVYAEWQMAAITMCVVLLFGVLGRSALPSNLSRQPRLTAVLILVILGVSTAISLMDYMQWHHDGRVLLLPVVIMAILVDLFYKALEKEGPLNAVMRLGWTLVQVAICLPVMQLESLGHWLVAHPEAHLLTLAATLSITAYRGQRLVNLFYKKNKHPFP